LSPSASFSASVSPSASASASLSPSASASPSISPSVSPSPSTGYSDYTREYNTILPTNDNDLGTYYSDQEESDVSTSNNVRVGQVGSAQYMIHQYKSFVGQRNYCDIKVELQSTLAGSSATIYLQIYNRNSSTWETLDSNSTVPADTDFTFLYSLSSLTNYKDSRNVICVRVYQLAI